MAAQQMTIEQGRAQLADVLMCHVLGPLCAAANVVERLSAVFYWHLAGEFEGDSVMYFLPESTGIRRLEGKPGASDGQVTWELSTAEMQAFFAGAYKLGGALRDGRLTVAADDSGMLKLAHVFGALARLDPAKVFSDPMGACQALVAQQLTGGPATKATLGGDLDVDIVGS